jgi:hypothetical protein
LDNYLRTTLRAKHPMELANAGRELSELMAPLLVDASMLAASRVAGGMARRGRKGIVPAQTAPTGVVDLGAQFPAVGALQTQLARHPEKALQALKTLVESGVEVTPQDILYAMQLNLAALKSKGQLTTDDKAYLKEYKVWADALQIKLGQAAKAPVAATAPSSLQTWASKNKSETMQPLSSAPSSATVNQTNSSAMTYKQTIPQPQQAASYLIPQSNNSSVSMLASEMTMTVNIITADLQPSPSAEEKPAFNFALLQVLQEHLHELTEQGKLAWLQQLRKDSILQKHLRLQALQRQQVIDDANHRSDVTPTGPLGGT